MVTPHEDLTVKSVKCAVITVSDSRNFATDKSGKLAQEILLKNGHQILDYTIIKDEPLEIKSILINSVSNPLLDCLIFSGGTGIAPRDNTYDIISKMLEKTLSGFGEIFRYLSYQEIGSRAIASRATAGVYRDKLIFCLPGSSNAVKLALEKLIIPELSHLLSQIRQDL